MDEEAIKSVAVIFSLFVPKLIVDCVSLKAETLTSTTESR